jgi:hypothetical protein
MPDLPSTGTGPALMDDYTLIGVATTTQCLVNQYLWQVSECISNQLLLQMLSGLLALMRMHKKGLAYFVSYKVVGFALEQQILQVEPDGSCRLCQRFLQPGIHGFK